MPEELDVFWKIALEYEAEHPSLNPEEDDGDIALEASSVSATFPLEPSSLPFIKLRLSQLALSDGAFSPVGAQLWYGSALLTSMMLAPELSQSRRFQDALHRRRLVVLELGSGAVGLPGLALAWRMAHYIGCECTVVLTDHDPDVLQQLVLNSKSALTQFSASKFASQIPDIQVEAFDWNDLDHGIYHRNYGFDLILGSELVYTEALGRACSLTVGNLLRRFPRALVAIIQVVDRDGWSQFLDELRKLGHQVDELSVDIKLHDMASRILNIRSLETMDRREFGLCYIYNSNNKSS